MKFEREQEVMFISYYTGQFSHDLQRFYHIVNDFGDRTYPFVLQMNSNEYENRYRRNMVWNGDEHYRMFSAAVYYMSMCTQVVGRLYGWGAMEDFMRASGWPMLNCGMGGLMNPIQTVWESGLTPSKGDQIYIQTLLTAGEYLKADFLDFFKPCVANLNHSAHSRLLSVVKIDELSAEFDLQQQKYCDWIRNPEIGYESHYVKYPVEER